MCRLIFLTAVNVGRPGVIHIGLHQILDFYGTFTTHGISFLAYRYLRFTHSVPIQKQRQPPRIPFAELRAISESFGASMDDICAELLVILTRTFPSSNFTAA